MTGDVLLQVLTDEKGVTIVLFRLHDSAGIMVADSDGFQPFTEGMEVRDGNGELLLRVPSVSEQSIEYRLYSCQGKLLTCSDGQRTQLFGGVRVDPIKPPTRAPMAHARSESTP